MHLPKKIRLRLFGAVLFCTAGLWPIACSSPRVSYSDQFAASSASLTWLEQHGGLIRDEAGQRLLRRIASRLGAAATETAAASLPVDDFSRLQHFPWQLHLYDSPSINAFSLGSGIIVITRGLLKQSETEAQLAAVISHEMSHHILGHTQRALEQSNRAPGQPGYSYSLQDELAADAVSVRILYVAGYDLGQALSALSLGYRLNEANVASPSWLDVRAAALTSEIRGYGQYLPATTNTREFNMVKRRLTS